MSLPDWFLEALRENGWQVRRMTEDQVPEALRGLLEEHAPVPAGGRRVRAWLQTAGVPIAREPVVACPWAVAEAAYGIAETGGVALGFGPDQPPWISLVPDRLLVLLPAHRVVPDLATLFRKASDLQGAPAWTLIHGPSVTADIEKEIVRGVHGPAEVHLWLVFPDARGMSDLPETS